MDPTTVAVAALAAGAIAAPLALWRVRLAARRRRYPIRELPGFLSEEECAHLIARARPVLQQSPVFVAGVGGTRHEAHRSSGTAVLDHAGDRIVQGIKRRIAELTGTRLEQQEHIQITHYLPGERYVNHFDAMSASGVDPGEPGDRLWTVILYLNDDYTGGATDFPRVRRRIRPERGKAVVFRNLTESAERWDPLSLHAGATVYTGEKWLSNQWIRQRDRFPGARPAKGRPARRR